MFQVRTKGEIDDDDEDEGKSSWGSDTMEENLEKLLEKYEKLTYEDDDLVGQGVNKLDDIIDDYDDSETDYYSMRIERRPNGMFTAMPANIEDEARFDEEKKNKSMTRTAANLEASLLEAGKELNDSVVSSGLCLSKADLNKIYAELNDIHQRLLV